MRTEHVRRTYTIPKRGFSAPFLFPWSQDAQRPPNAATNLIDPMSESADATPEWLASNATADESGYGATSSESLGGEARGGPSSSSSLQKAQSISTMISLLLSPVAIILVSLWVSALGGVSWSEGNSKTNFNWHPVMMISAYALMNVGTLIFRVTGTSSASVSSSIAVNNSKKRKIAKATHASIWSTSFILGIVGVLAVVKSHNDAISGYIANLYSFHSWVGVFVLVLYTLQFLYGMLVLGLGCSVRLSNPTMMSIHKYIGSYIHILVMATIMLGIQEKEGFVSCGYTVTEADVMPITNYHLIPHTCKLSHGLGLVVLGMGICTSFALAHFPSL